MTNAELADAFEHGKLWIAGDADWMPWITGHPRFKEQIIAALRQSSDKMLVPREPTEAQKHLAMMNDSPSYRQNSLTFYRAMLTAAAAEGHHE